jgi:tripartite-type tricarboxylate transporter receptor subunit TctC
MTVQSNSKGGAIRVLAVTTKDPSPDLPGVPTAEQQGFKVYSDTYGFIIAPAGTPSDMTNAYSEALKNVIDNNEARSSMAKVLGNVVKYEPPEEANQIWDRLETELKPLLDQPRN